MHDITLHSEFIPQGCVHTMQPQRAVTVGAGTIGMQAYQAVTTEAGGSFGVISKMTLRVHDLPEHFGVATLAITAKSDDASHRLVRQFVSFYRQHLFNDHWGEQAHISRNNTLGINMLGHGLDAEQVTQLTTKSDT